MIEQLNHAVRFRAFFTAARQGKTGLSVTVDVYAPDDSLVVTAAAATAIGQGLYSYTLPSGSVTLTGEYTALFKTADSTVDSQVIPALWVVGRAGIGNLDAPVSQVPAALLDTALAGHITTATVGGTLAKLNVPTPSAPIVVIPGAPPQAAACRVYGYLELPDKTPAANVGIRFELIAPGPVASDRLIAGRVVNATTDSTGQLIGADGNAWQDLNRTDMLTQTAAAYEVTCEALGVRRKLVTLTTSTADLKTLLT